MIGDIGFLGVEAKSENEAVETAMKKAGETLKNEGKRYPAFVKPEIILINGKTYRAPHEYTKIQMKIDV